MAGGLELLDDLQGELFHAEILPYAVEMLYCVNGRRITVEELSAKRMNPKVVYNGEDSIPWLFNKKDGCGIRNIIGTNLWD